MLFDPPLAYNGGGLCKHVPAWTELDQGKRLSTCLISHLLFQLMMSISGHHVLKWRNTVVERFGIPDHSPKKRHQKKTHWLLRSMFALEVMSRIADVRAPLMAPFGPGSSSDVSPWRHPLSKMTSKFSPAAPVCFETTKSCKLLLFERPSLCGQHCQDPLNYMGFSVALRKDRLETRFPCDTPITRAQSKSRRAFCRTTECGSVACCVQTTRTPTIHAVQAD